MVGRVACYYMDIFFSRVAEVNDHFEFPVPIGIQYVEIQVFAPFTFFKFFQSWRAHVETIKSRMCYFSGSEKCGNFMDSVPDSYDWLKCVHCSQERNSVFDKQKHAHRFEAQLEYSDSFFGTVIFEQGRNVEGVFFYIVIILIILCLLKHSFSI